MVDWDALLDDDDLARGGFVDKMNFRVSMLAIDDMFARNMNMELL